MTTPVPAPRAPRARVRPAIAVAAVASAGAGLVHAAAARNHDGDQLLVVLFALCALGQVAWAAAALVRPVRWTLLGGLVVNGGALVVWSLTRTVGIPFIDSLSVAESVGTPDLAGALFAAASVLGVATVLLRPAPRTVLHPAGVAALAAFALVAALPAMSAGHTHEHSGDLHLDAAGHDHDDDEAAHGAGEGHDDHAEGAAHAEGDHGDAGHDDHADDAAHAEDDHGGHAAGDLVAQDGHGDHGSTSSDPAAGHGDHSDPVTHPTHPPTTDGSHDHPTDPDPGPTGPIISLDDPRVTAQQRDIAQNLITTTTAGMAPFTTEAQVMAAGYTSIGDGGADGYEHFVNWSYLTDSYELDPTRIESIVMKKTPGAPKTVVSAMYILKLGTTMANVPPLAGPLTTWHDHQNLCFEGTRLVGTTVDGVCTRGTLLPTPPMLHVWLVPHPCGPFAGIETHGGDACGGHDGH